VSTKPPSNADSRRFEPIDPWKSAHLSRRRRNLPHLAVPGATYFVTFRAKLALSPAARDVVIAIIRACDQRSVDLDGTVVMPDHAHLIFRLMEPNELPQVLQHIKGRSARTIDQMLEREGSIWSDESFDHIIRHPEELEEKLQYVRQKSGY
jgi:REP element-mobilizing transposase RayT